MPASAGTRRFAKCRGQFSRGFSASRYGKNRIDLLRGGGGRSASRFAGERTFISSKCKQFDYILTSVKSPRGGPTTNLKTLLTSILKVSYCHFNKLRFGRPLFLSFWGAFIWSDFRGEALIPKGRLGIFPAKKEENFGWSRFVRVYVSVRSITYIALVSTNCSIA